METYKAAIVNICVTFVISTINLVEIICHNPSHTTLGLQAHKLLEKRVFKVGSSDVPLGGGNQDRAGVLCTTRGVSSDLTGLDSSRSTRNLLMNI